MTALTAPEPRRHTLHAMTRFLWWMQLLIVVFVTAGIVIAAIKL